MPNPHNLRKTDDLSQILVDYKNGLMLLEQAEKKIRDYFYKELKKVFE